MGRWWGDKVELSEEQVFDYKPEYAFKNTA